MLSAQQHQLILWCIRWFNSIYYVFFAGCRHQRAWRKVDWVERVAQCCRCWPGCCCFHFSFNCKCCSCFLVLVLYAVLIDEVVVAILVEGPAICFAGCLSLLYFFKLKEPFPSFSRWKLWSSWCPAEPMWTTAPSTIRTHPLFILLWPSFMLK